VPSVAAFFLHRCAFVNGHVVEQYNAWHRMRLAGDLIEEGDDVFALCRSLLRRPDQLTIMAQCAKHVDPLPVRQRRYGPSFTNQVFRGAQHYVVTGE
jgi:hypothetical protein